MDMISTNEHDKNKQGLAAFFLYPENPVNPVC